VTIPLPAIARQWLRPLAQWPPVALREPQLLIQVRLVTDNGAFDVTHTAVVAALRPLTLAIGFDIALTAAIEALSQPQLRFVDLESQQTVGTLQLQHLRNWNTAGVTIGLFEVRGSAHRCLRWPHRSWNHWLQNRRMRRQHDSPNFAMPPEAVQQMMIFYICPRPVVLVSVDDRTHSNLFPMDLIGPVSADRFTLALRSTSPSIPTMKSARRVALSDVPASEYATAYKLGVHHKSAMVDWHQLPFAIRRTRDFQLPYPAIALRVRELEILDSASIGSHTVFVTRVASESSFTQDPQLFHASGIYQHFRERHGRQLPTAGPRS
jgi:flavin reductase (DIM6/NTAB) family NADH-FMN oxidoreductase RutF